MVTSARDQLNSYSTALYTINPDPMTKAYIQSYSTSGIGNRYALSFQKAVLLCNFSNGAAMAIRDYFERTITRASQLDFTVDSINAPTQVSDSKINVTVLFMNNHFGLGKQTVPISCSIAGGDTVSQNQIFDTDFYAGYYVSFTLNASSEGVKAITAKINGGLSGSRTFDEKTYTNNELSQNVTFTIPKDLSASIASIKDANGNLISSSNPAVEQQTVTVNVDWKNLSNKSLSNIPKQGSVTTNSINSDSFLLLLKNALSANGSGNSFANSYDGATRFALNNCQVSYSISNTLTIRCTYTLQIPTYLFGNQIFAPEVPVQLHSDYQIK